MGERAGAILAKTLVAAFLCFIAWTIVASLVFLTGTRLLHAFPHPFWQWWLYFLEVHGDPIVDKWLKLGAAAGLVMPILIVVAVIVRRQSVSRPRRPFFGGPAAAQDALTDNYGRARWMTMERALETFPGIDPLYGGIVVGEAYRVDLDSVAKVQFNPRLPNTWGRGANLSFLSIPATAVPPIRW